MKNLTHLLTFLILFQIILYSQGWEPEVKIVSTGYYAGWADLAVLENNLYVTWFDLRDPAMMAQIYFKKSDDQGLIWNPGHRITGHIQGGESPAVASFGSHVHLAWADKHDNSPHEIYYRRSTDFGNTFETEQRLTNKTSPKEDVDIAVFENNIHIVWSDNSATTTHIYYLHSTDNGSTWSGATQLTNNPSRYDFYPQIDVSGSNVFVFWVGGNDVYFLRSVNNGINWETERKLTTTAQVGRVDLAAFDDKIHIAYTDQSTGSQNEIFYMNSLNLGVDWSPETRLTFNGVKTARPSIATFFDIVSLVWVDFRGSDAEIYFRTSTNNGANWDGEIRLSSLPNKSYRPTVEMFDANVYVVWQDEISLGNEEIVFRRYVAPTPVESEIIPPSEFTLLQNYPNPFNPSTNIKYSIPQASQAIIKVFDMLGNEIETLVNEEKPTGTYEITWNAESLPSGIYFYRLQAGEFVQTKKMVLMK
jgi:hypothetical protein